MGEIIQLKASDGHELAAYVAEPEGNPRGGIVVVQEIFGVNSHIRGVADGFAADRLAEDAVRTAHLETQGYRVLRYWNNEVLANSDAVVEAILIALQKE